MKCPNCGVEIRENKIKNNINNISLESIGMESFVPSEKTTHETSPEEKERQLNYHKIQTKILI